MVSSISLCWKRNSPFISKLSFLLIPLFECDVTLKIFLKKEMITKSFGWYTAHAIPSLVCSSLPFLLLSHNYLWKRVPFEISFHSSFHLLSSVIFVFTTVAIRYVYSLLFSFHSMEIYQCMESADLPGSEIPNP